MAPTMTLLPSSLDELLLKRRGLRLRLSALDGLKEIRIAILGGTTTNELVDLLEILPPHRGFRPAFYQSDCGRYYEDSLVITRESNAKTVPDWDSLRTSTSSRRLRRSTRSSSGWPSCRSSRTSAI
jgi:hypothetical protein